MILDILLLLHYLIGLVSLIRYIWWHNTRWIGRNFSKNEQKFGIYEMSVVPLLAILGPVIAALAYQGYKDKIQSIKR